jgi:hypothetical protein
MDFPATFRVGASVKFWSGGGRLTIAPGMIILETGRLLRGATSVARVVHTDPTVTLIHARLLPPWFNTHLVLQGEDVSGVASTWFGARRRLRHALRAAGFEPVEVRTWLSMGRGARGLSLQ